MAKKQETKTKTVEQSQVVEQPRRKPHPEDGWEIKDRVYNLKGHHRPLSKLIKSADIYWFDEEKGYERELKYCENQQTCFVDEMKGEQRLEHIIFRSGSLMVPKNKTVFSLVTCKAPFLKIICDNL